METPSPFNFFPNGQQGAYYRPDDLKGSRPNKESSFLQPGLASILDGAIVVLFEEIEVKVVYFQYASNVGKTVLYNRATSTRFH